MPRSIFAVSKMTIETIEKIVGYVAEVICLGAASYGLYWLYKSETSFDNQEYFKFNDHNKENKDLGNIKENGLGKN